MVNWEWLEGAESSVCVSYQAAAALCISVGSFSDPDDLPGLAHFLEHSESCDLTLSLTDQ